MRMLSLLISLLIVGWLIYTQLGGDKAATEAATYRQAEQRAEAVSAQVQAQFEQQAAQISQLERAGQAARTLEQAPTESAP